MPLKINTSEEENEKRKEKNRNGIVKHLKNCDKIVSSFVWKFYSMWIKWILLVIIHFKWMSSNSDEYRILNCREDWNKILMNWIVTIKRFKQWTVNELNWIFCESCERTHKEALYSRNLYENNKWNESENECFSFNLNESFRLKFIDKTVRFLAKKYFNLMRMAKEIKFKSVNWTERDWNRTWFLAFPP